jgi:hypothetical protein
MSGMHKHEHRHEHEEVKIEAMFSSLKHVCFAAKIIV